jgi:hypothetical protein
MIALTAPDEYPSDAQCQCVPLNPTMHDQHLVGPHWRGRELVKVPLPSLREVLLGGVRTR